MHYFKTLPLHKLFIIRIKLVFFKFNKPIFFCYRWHHFTKNTPIYHAQTRFSQPEENISHRVTPPMMIVAETIPAEVNSHTDSALRGAPFVNLPFVPECKNCLQKRTTTVRIVKFSQLQQEIMKAQLTYRGRSLIQSRARRNQEDTVEEDDQFQDSDSVEDRIIYSLRVAISGTCSHVTRLANVKRLVTLFRQAADAAFAIGLSAEEVFIIRCLLLDEESEIRLVSLLCLRWLLRSLDDFKVAVKLGIDHLVVRCFETALDDDSDRIACLRLFMYIIDRFPNDVPTSIVKSLMAVIFHGQTEGDSLAMAALALICELTVRHRVIVLHCNSFLNCISRQMLMSPFPRQVQCLSYLMCYFFNSIAASDVPVNHRSAFYYELLAPLMEPNYGKSLDLEKPQHNGPFKSDNVLNNCRIAIISSLRTWSGLIHCLSVDNLPISCRRTVDLGEIENCPITCIFSALRIEDSPIQKTAVKILCDLALADFADEEFSCWDDVRAYKTGTRMSSLYQSKVNENFILADAELLKKFWDRKRMDLSDLCLTFSLYCLVQRGILQILCRMVIVDPDDPLNIKITVLIEEILNTGFHWFKNMTLKSALGWDQLYDSQNLPILDGILKNRGLMVMNRINELRAYRDQMTFKYLLFDLIYRRSTPKKFASHSEPYGTAIQRCNKDYVLKLIPETKVLSLNMSQWQEWDWLLIDHAMSILPTIAEFYEEETFVKLTRTVLQFFEPQGPFKDICEDYRSYSRVCCKLMNVLSKAPVDSAMNQQLQGFLKNLLIELSPENLYLGILCKRSLDTTAAVDYFAFIFQLSSTKEGLEQLCRAGVVDSPAQKQFIICINFCAQGWYFGFAPGNPSRSGAQKYSQKANDPLRMPFLRQQSRRFMEILKKNPSHYYTKAIVSCLCFDGQDLADAELSTRKILETVLTDAAKESRIYAIRFLLMLGHLQCNGYEDWGLKLMTDRLNDSSMEVVAVVVEALHSLMTIGVYKSSFVKLNVDLSKIDDAGVLLNTYRYSFDEALRASDEHLKACIVEVNYWNYSFCEQYAAMVEEMITEIQGNFETQPDGAFPTHASCNEERRDAFLPPHLFGQLSLHMTGCCIMVELGVIYRLMQTLHQFPADSTDQCLKLKSALLAVGQIASTELGLLLLPVCAIPCLVQIIEESHLCDLKGFAYYAMMLVSGTGMGSSILSLLSWNHSVECELSDEDFCQRLDSFFEDLHNVAKLSWRQRNLGSEYGFSGVSNQTRTLESDASSMVCIWCEYRRALYDSMLAEGDGGRGSFDFVKEVELREIRMSSSNLIVRSCSRLDTRLDAGLDSGKLSGSDVVEMDSPADQRNQRMPLFRRFKLEHERSKRIRQSTPSTDYSISSTMPLSCSLDGSLAVSPRAAQRSPLSSAVSPIPLSTTAAARLLDKSIITSLASTSVCDSLKEANRLCELQTRDRMAEYTPSEHSNSPRICIPDRIDQLCNLNPYFKVTENIDDQSADNSDDCEEIFREIESHCVQSCFLCGSSGLPSPPILTIPVPKPDSDFASSDAASVAGKRITSSSFELDPCRTSKTSLSDYLCLLAMTNSNSSEKELPPDVERDVRLEAARLISVLPVRPKFAERSLLRLKRDYPELLTSVCFYSDICNLLSAHPFPLKARQFLQELFSEANFQCLWSRPRKVLQSLGEWTTDSHAKAVAGHI
ncbi:Rapamycin-insensitive companion of mTOR [Trichinella pseudospiralis]|uniref:Rapamycin-insensitive companion of mTOR n=1 Tax=Trichinella pseudospiralis TaxID=6337 RepID=A0A0V1J1Z8_TRIPS|nr:Rapamycin-insensitive companion of mTOR [Trichinella pseudospiralis]